MLKTKKAIKLVELISNEEGDLTLKGKKVKATPIGQPKFIAVSRNIDRSLSRYHKHIPKNANSYSRSEEPAFPPIYAIQFYRLKK